MSASYEHRLSEIEGVNADQVRAIVAMPSFDTAKLRGLGLSPKQVAEIERAHDSHIAGQAGAMIGGGLLGGASMIFIVGSFVSGVFGWILVLRKKVIACAICKGIHSEAV